MEIEKKYKEFLINEGAIEYFREQLSGGNALAKLMLQRADFDDGEIMTLVPRDMQIEEEQLHKFESGFLPEPPPETHRKVEGGIAVPIPDDIFPFLVDKISSYLQERENNLCIFEEVNFTPSSPCVAKYSIPYWVYGDEIYYCSLQKDVENKNIERVARQAFTFYPGLIGAMTSVQSSDEVSVDKKVITLDQLKMFTDRLEKIILGAYDGEGYLIWQKPG